MQVAVSLFATWLILSNLWINPSYTAAAPYHAAFLLCGFLLGRRAGAPNARLLFAAALVFAVGLAGWALWQRMGQGVSRAHALFETPATLTSTLNLALLPGFVLLVWGKRNWLLFSVLVVLSAALVAAQSRGGWLAFAVGGLISILLARRAGMQLGWIQGLKVLAVFVLGWGLVQIASPTYQWLAAILASGAGSQQPAIAELQHGATFLAPGSAASSLARVGLYELAWKTLSFPALLIGNGYLDFYYVLKAARHDIPTYGESFTYFVHNDYLQTLLELGLPGVAGLLALVTLPFVNSWRAVCKPNLAPEQRLIIVATVASLASMATHALVDFPFYVPVCLALFGTALGVLDAALVPASKHTTDDTPRVRSSPFRRAAVAALGTLVIWILAMPVVAEAAAAFAQRQWRSGQAESAAYWFEMARRIEPRDWRYHWYAGQFWFATARSNRNAKAAQQADESFAAGFAANPREVANLTGRIITQRHLREFLPAPVPPDTLFQWADKAVTLAPRDHAALAERAGLMNQFGELSARDRK